MKRHARLAHLHKTAVSLGVCLSAVAFVGISAETATAQTGARPAASPRSSNVRTAYAETSATAASTPGNVHRDPQVVQAGAMLHHSKRVCPQGGCGPGGQCQGTCVVRPGRFGFYATQWRAWPGDQGVQQASLQEMTPVSPPASAIPAVDEEALLPSSLMPDDDDAGFGSDNFGFEPVEPAPQSPPPAPTDEGTFPAAEPEPDAVSPEPAPSKPSLFDPEPRVPATETAPPAESPDAAEQPNKEGKPKESIDNLFDEFGRTSATQSGNLRRRLAAANQEFARRKAEQVSAAERQAQAVQPDAWRPRQLAPSTASRPLVAAPTLSSRRVVPATAQQSVSPNGNPLR
ncbi:MAG: hypothetical protein ACO3NZ_06440 [Pirellulales bacterium]